MNDSTEELDGQYVQGFDVYQSEEFKAFCKRFGIQWGLRTREITLVIPCDGLMTVKQEYITKHQKENADVPEYVDTTSLQNTKYRTLDVLRKE